MLADKANVTEKASQQKKKKNEIEIFGDEKKRKKPESFYWSKYRQISRKKYNKTKSSTKIR